MNNNEKETSQKAANLEWGKRKEILLSFKEKDLHFQLKELFQKMEKDIYIEVTHGTNEYGKDLVLLKEERIMGIEATGVVVKKGNIKGTTLGEVDEIKRNVKEILSKGSEKRLDEIKSQIEQAFNHEAELGVSIEKIPIENVIVILVGEISKNGKERIRKEFPKVRIRDLHWLIENFTVYYPQIFFEGEVLDFVQKKILSYEGNQLISKTLNLSEYYVESWVTPSETPIETILEEGIIKSEKNKIPISQIKKLIKPNNKLLIIGDPGMGKTAALAKLSIDVLKGVSKKMLKNPGQRIKEKYEIPINIKATELLNIGSVEDLKEKFFGDQNLLEKFQVKAIMVDALDEVQPNNREKILNKASTFSSEIGCCLIITSRRIDILEKGYKDFKRYELIPFEFGQALKLLQKLVSHDRTKLDELKNGLEKIKFQIPLIPLSLMLLLEVVEKHNEVPASVTELYDRFFDLALGRYDSDKGIEVLFEYRIKKKFFSSLAYGKFFGEEKLEIDKGDYDEFIKEFINDYGYDFSQFYAEIERTNLIKEKNNIIIFKHRSFLDYLTAVYIFENRELFENLNRKISCFYHNDLWSDVAFFFIGLKREISIEMIDSIFSNSQNDFYGLVNSYMIGRLLQAGWNSKTKVKKYGIERGIQCSSDIKSSFLELGKKATGEIPQIYADFFLLFLADHSFSSVFLEKESIQIVHDFLEREDSSELDCLIPLLWAQQRLLEPQKLNELTTKILELASKKGICLGDEARILMLLILIENKDKSIQKTAQKRLKKMVKRNPEYFEGVFPKKRK